MIERKWIIVHQPYDGCFSTPVEEYITKGTLGSWLWTSDVDNAYVFTYKAAWHVREKMTSGRKWFGRRVFLRSIA